MEELMFVSPEDWLAVGNVDGPPISQCIECGGIGIKVHEQFGNIMCLCGQRKCPRCNGMGYLTNGYDNFTCHHCDGYKFQVLARNVKRWE